MSIFRRVGKSKARPPVPAAPALESADLTDSDEEEGRPGHGGPAEPSLAEPSAGTATNAGELRINVVSGHGLVPGETYAKILVKAGDGARSERTSTARSVGDVLQWSGAHFRFERIWSPSVQVVVVLKNYNRLGANDRLGQIGQRPTTTLDAQVPGSLDIDPETFSEQAVENPRALPCLRCSPVPQVIRNWAEGATCQTEQSSCFAFEVRQRQLEFAFDRGSRMAQSQQATKPAISTARGHQQQ